MSMKFTLSWLKDHLETDASLTQIADTLTVIGLEVEQIVDPAAELASFVAARVVKAEPHPDADKLKVAIVDDGKDKHQVVCGAPNCRTGMTGVFAPVGAYIPGSDFTLKKAKIRGVDSSGMLCSERELQISDEHDGIIELKGRVRPGRPVAELLGLDDPMIEVAITPNRGDCLGVRGIARDLAAAGLGRLKPARIGPVKGAFASPLEVQIKLPKGKTDACPVFHGRLIRGVRNQPSPDWLQHRLIAIGERPINALVDITNYISFDRGRPLHVYDADKLAGPVVVRTGKKGESFLGLDGKEYAVDADMTVIADQAQVLGLGGVLGGETSGCTAETKDVFIESAWFDPIRTAMTGRRTGIQSGARYRFERGVDPQTVPLGIDYATKLVLEICGGEPGEVVTAGEIPDLSHVIQFDTRRVKRLTGIERMNGTMVRNTLKKLGFKVAGRIPDLEITVPSFRPDVHGPADLVEEITRIYGVDNIPSTPLPRVSGVARPVLTMMQRRQRRARRLLATRGMVEAITWSFLGGDQAQPFLEGRAPLELDNPISTGLAVMRPSLLPGLLAAAQRTLDRALGDPALFELGNVYHGMKASDQFRHIAGLRCGTARPMGGGRFWDHQGEGAQGQMQQSQTQWIDARADALAVLEALGLEPAALMTGRAVPDWYHPGRAGALTLGPKRVLAYFGALHPALLDQFGIDVPVTGFELLLDNLPVPKARRGRTRPALEITDLQPLRRDFAFVVDADTPADKVLRAARGADKALITDVVLFDIFTGESLGADKKSLAIEVTVQPRTASLTDAEIEKLSGRIVAAVQKAAGGQLRG